MDSATIDRARRGDRAAQAALLRQLQDPWYRLCRTLLRNEDDARDATQETALRFLRELPRFRGDSSVTTWSIGIAINVAREMRRGADRPAGDDLVLSAATDAPRPIEASLQASELNELLRTTLDELSDRQREAIVLRYFEELTVEETAAAMGCAAGTVKATVHQALRALRAKLRQFT